MNQQFRHLNPYNEKRSVFSPGTLYRPPLQPSKTAQGGNTSIDWSKYGVAEKSEAGIDWDKYIPQGDPSSGQGGVFKQLQNKQNQSTGGLFQQLVKPTEPSFFEQRRKELGINQPDNFIQNRKMDLGIIPDTRPKSIEPVQQEPKSNWFADSQKAIYNKTLKPAQDFVQRFASGTATSPTVRDFMRKNQLESTPDFVKEMISEPDTTSEKVADIAGTFYGYGAAGVGGSALLRKPVQKLLTNKLGRFVVEGAGVGAGVTAGEIARDESFSPDMYDAKDHSINAALNIVGGAALDPAIAIGGPKALGALKRFFGKDKVKKSELTKALDDPTTPQEVKDEILQLPEGKTFMKPRDTPQPIKENFVSAKKKPNNWADRLEEFRNVAMSQNLPPGREKEAMEEIWRNMSRYDESITLDKLIELGTPSLKQLQKRTSGNLKNPAEPNQFGVSKADQLGVNTRLKDNPINFTMMDKMPLEYVGRLQPMNKLKVQKADSITPDGLRLSSTGALNNSLQANREVAAGLLKAPKLQSLSAQSKGLEPPPLKSLRPKEVAAGSLKSLRPKLKSLSAQSFTPAEEAFIVAQKQYEPLAKKDFKEWTDADFALNEKIRKPLQAAEMNLQKQGYGPDDIEAFMSRHESSLNKPLSARLPQLKASKMESLSQSPKVERTLNHYSTKQKELEKLVKDGADDKQISAARNQAKDIARSMDADQLAKDLYIKPPSMKVVDGRQTINADDFTPRRVQQAMDIALDNSKVNWSTATDQNVFFGNFKTLHRLVNSMFKENTLKAEPENLVKRIGIDSFNDSKREMHKHLETIASDLKTNLQQFGITKNSKKSAIAMAHGEGKISLDEVKRQFPNDWEKVVSAKDYARKFYDEMIDMQNEVLTKIHANLKGDALAEKLIPKRKDYFRHMQEDNAKFRDVLDMIDSAAGIRNVDNVVKPLAKKGKDLGTRLKEKVLGRKIKIDPELVGTSEYTNPKSKFNTTKMKRTSDETDFDLMGGMLDYSNQATYQMYVSPYIQVIDALEKGLVSRTNGNMNNYIELFQGIKQVLQGKTLPFDRVIQKKLGREMMRTMDAVNTRVRKNSVLASASAMAAQFTHLPNAVAIGGAKNFSEGAREYFKHVFKKSDLDPLKKSTFMKERYATNDLLRQFETGFINKTTDKAGKISLEVMDKIAGEVTWRTMYSKALKEGSKNPTRRADDLTRDILGARGRGEKSLIMSERMTNMYMPFQLEVANNAMIMGELIKNRQGKEFLRLITANYLFNGLVGYTVGRKFMFDPIKSMYDAHNLAQEESETSQKVYKAAGRIAGEIASPLPGAAVWGSALGTPQFKKNFFGDVDPTRYGSDPLVTGAINDPLFKFATPFGGAQLKRTLQGASSLAQGGNYGSDLSTLQRGAKTMLGGESEGEGDKLRFPVERTPANTARALIGGPWNTKEGKEYLEKNRRPLSENQTQDFNKKVDRGRDSATIYQSLMLDRELSAIEKKIKEERKEGKTIGQVQKLLDERLKILSKRRQLMSN